MKTMKTYSRKYPSKNLEAFIACQRLEEAKIFYTNTFMRWSQPEMTLTAYYVTENQQQLMEQLGFKEVIQEC